MMVFPRASTIFREKSKSSTTEELLVVDGSNSAPFIRSSTIVNTKLAKMTIFGSGREKLGFPNQCCSCAHSSWTCVFPQRSSSSCQSVIDSPNTSKLSESRRDGNIVTMSKRMLDPSSITLAASTSAPRRRCAHTRPECSSHRMLGSKQAGSSELHDEVMRTANFRSSSNVYQFSDELFSRTLSWIMVRAWCSASDCDALWVPRPIHAIAGTRLEVIRR